MTQEEKKILHLTLKRKWFDMIAAGIKTDEYREIKPYWIKRLIKPEFAWAKQNVIMGHDIPPSHFNHYDIIRFRNGYRPDSPTVDIELKSISVGIGNPEHGAPDYPVFRLHLNLNLIK